jgi:hypothetical protein
VSPYPVDFSIDPRVDLRATFSLLDGLNDSTLTGREWVGLGGLSAKGVDA